MQAAPKKVRNMFVDVMKSIARSNFKLIKQCR
jgi:hypothetical protein